MPSPLRLGQVQRDVVAAHHDILRGTHDRLAVGGAEDVVGGHHQRVCFDLGLDRQRQMDGHLVTVEVRVEALANQRMQVDRVAFDQHRLERLDSHAVQRRGTIQQYRVVLDHRLEDVPDFLVLALQHLLGALDRVRVPQFFELADDERLVQFQRDLLGQAALVQPKRRADHDHAARRIIHAFAQQVLTKPALLALDHVRQRLQRPVAAAQDRAFAAIVIEQRVHRLLQHPLLVADDDLRRVQVHQLAEPVVPVDDPPIQVVEVAGGEIARVQQHQRTQVRRDDGDHIQHHPLRAIVAVADRFHDLQAVDQVFFLLLGVGFDQIFAEVLRQLDEVQAAEQFADGLRPHVRLEARVAPLFPGRAVLLFGQQLLLFQLRPHGIDDDVVLEIDHLLQTRRLHVQQVAQPAGHRLEEPDMDDGGRQFDVAHPFPADAGMGDLDPAAVADHALVLHASILAARAFPVLFRAENAFAEQAVLFGTISAVVDRFGFLHLAERPAADVVGSSQADLD